MIGSWREFILQEQTKPYYYEIVKRVQADRKLVEVYPPEKEIFNAFKHCPLDKVRAVVLGQDPYTGGQAHGLAFSVLPDVTIPPSLQNIFKELNADLGTEITFSSGCLLDWAKQGVMLLNTSLTVKAGEAGSHVNTGWATFTDAAIQVINQLDRPIVHMLWGGSARKKKALLSNPKHLVLESSHPSPLAVFRGFEGCKHFSKTNAFLTENGLDPIDWNIR